MYFINKMKRFITIILCVSVGCSCLWAQGWSRISRWQHHMPAAWLPGQGVNATPYNKGSLFTKDALLHVSFAAGDSLAKYTVGTLSAATTIGGEVAAAHGQTAAFSSWHRIADNSAATYGSLTTRYPVTLAAPWGFASLDALASGSAADGFMLMTMMDQCSAMGGNGAAGSFDAYIALAPVDATGVTTPLDVTFWQLYRKSANDHCYVDYSSDGSSWDAVEVNVAGIDIETGRQQCGHTRATLPLNCCGQGALYIRLRWTSSSNAGGVYGYYWAIDDLTVAAGGTSRLDVACVNYAEGFYPIMPAGLQTPVAASMMVSNNGSMPQSGVCAAIYTMNDGGVAGSLSAPRQAAVSGAVSVPAAPEQRTRLLIDPLALINGGDNWCYFPGNGAATGTVGCLPTDLDSNTTGYYYTTVGNGSISYAKDTMSYRVTAGGSVPQLREARLWGRDNGVLRSGSAFHWSLDEDRNIVNPGTLYAGSWNLTGYGVTVSFATGASVPDNWVVRGIQLVTATDGDVEAGAVLMPVLTHDSMDEQYIYTMDIASNASSYVVKAADLPQAGGPEYSTLGHYRTINLVLPAQPPLKPMTNYNVGYQLMDSAHFAVATGTDYYTRQSDGAAVPFSQVPGMEDYAKTPTADWHKVRFYDPRHGTWVSAGRMLGAEVPMIRMIVGPKVYMVSYGLTVSCGEDGTITDAEDNNLCGQVDSLEQGSTNIFYIRGDAGYELSEVTLDGMVLTNGGQLTVMRDPETHAKYGMLTLEDVQEPHTLSATFTQKVGIDPVADGISVRIQPNPASDMANIAVSGATGTLCYCLLDMSGRVICRGGLAAEDVVALSLRELPRGAYLLRVTGNAFSKVEKLIVK